MSLNEVNNVDEADIAECDGEKVVTMMDVLQEQQEFEDDANAVLGASDDKECTYAKGYINRQAIYACLTCCSGAKDDPTQRAGVCLACSLNCHENHELIELYTKRNFRCDCGNPKFNSNPCQFTPNKTELNEDNKYNQNFNGLYCICNKPYPDPEATVEDEMIQCIICEDWLHSRHLDAVVPANDMYAEMICKSCMEENSFLHDYSQLAVNLEVDVDVTAVNANDNPNDGDNTAGIHLVNAEMDTCKTTPVKIKMENGEAELEGHSSTNKDDEIREDDKTTNSMDWKIQSCSTLLTDTDQNTKPGEPIPQDIEVTENHETQSNFKTSDTTYSQMDTQDADQKVVDENKEETKPSPEQREENITEQVLTPTQDSHEGNTKLFEDKTNNKTEDNEQSTISSDIHEKDQTVQGSNPIEGVSNQIPVKMKTIVNPTQINSREFDSLEAATKDLSELVDDGAHTSNNLEMNVNGKKATKVQSIINENGFKDAVTNRDTDTNAVENDVNTPSNQNIDHKRKLNITTEEVTMKKQKVNNIDECIRPQGVKRTIKGAAFWPPNFRQKLCTCNECQIMYKDLSVLFLIDPEDTVTAYETLGIEKIDGEPATQYEKGLQALSSLDRVQQINALTEYNRMRDKLLEFLKSFKDRKEIVKEEDIKAFFAGMKARREPDGVYFCR